MLRRLFAIAAFLIAVLGVSRASAVTFDAQGVAHFDPKAVKVERFGATALQPGLVIREAPDALEGDTYAFVTETNQGVQFPIDLPTTDRSYRARFFVRKARVIADMRIQNAGAEGMPSFSVRFFPTGRVTSDGWYEVTTALFSFEGKRGASLTFTVISSGADVDAFELTTEGDFKAPVACEQAFDPACDTGDFCAAGWCRNGAANVPPLPTNQDRDFVVSYLEERFKIFFGGRYTRANRLPTAIATLESLRSAVDPWIFWNGFVTSLHQLHDWHSTLNGPGGVAGRGAFPICLVEGDADLSRALAPSDPRYADVIVSHVGPDQNSGFKPGDRIVAIDGKHPIPWAESLDAVDWGAWKADDPNVHAEAMERLRILIRRWAKTLTIIHCDPVARTCSPPQDILTSKLPRQEPAIYPSCDHRPHYHLKTGGPDEVTHQVLDVYHGLLRDSLPGENLYGMIWDDVYLDGSGTNPYTASIEEFRANASGLILDHRTGNGGTAIAASYLTSLFRAPALLAASTGYDQTLGLLDAPFSTFDGLRLFSVHSGGDGYTVGSKTARTTLKTALLLARDGSASDWFPYGMSGAPSVRIFGRRSAGAFSSYIQFDYFGDLNWRVASGDLIRADGTTHLGEGVPPDEDLLPKQSDLLVGRDTVYERALAWIRTP